MPLPIVAIAAEDSRFAPGAQSVIVASCARASGEGRCVERNAPLAAAALYVATVTFNTSGKLHIDLHTATDHVRRGERELVFAASQLGEEHWNSTGLVIAALVADVDASTKESEPASVLATPPTATPGRDLWLDVGVSGVAAAGFDFAPWRFGVELRLGAGSRHAAVYPVLTTRWATASGLVPSRTLSQSLGAGLDLIPQHDALGLQLEATGVAETLLISANTAAGKQQSYRVRYGARVGLNSSLALSSGLRASLGVDATWLHNPASVEVDGTRLGSEHRYVPAFRLGLSYRF